jgi:hypothetical protein
MGRFAGQSEAVLQRLADQQLVEGAEEQIRRSVEVLQAVFLKGQGLQAQDRALARQDQQHRFRQGLQARPLLHQQLPGRHHAEKQPGCALVDLHLDGGADGLMPQQAQKNVAVEQQTAS